MVTILTVIASWKLLVKSGEKGWKTLIPFYGRYTEFKQFYDVKLFWNYLIGYSITFVLAVLALIFAKPCYGCYSLYRFCSFRSCCCSLGFFGVLAIITGAVTFCVNIISNMLLLFYTGKAFNAKPFHCLAMMFVAPFAVIALGLDDSFTYSGNKRPDCLGRKPKTENNN